MFCKHCGSQIADDAIFCSKCGTRLVEDVPAAPQVGQVQEPAPQIQAAGSTVLRDVAAVQAVTGDVAAVQAVTGGVEATPTEPEAPAKPFLEGMEWNVSEYPDSNVATQTEDIDFDWGMDPVEVPELRARRPEPVEPAKAAEPQTPEAQTVSQVFDRVVPVEEAKAAIPVQEAMEAASKVEEVGQFNTFNRKNAEFQQLLDREYDKVRGAGTIGHEQSEADQAAAQKFEARQEDVTMDDFLQKEGVVKLYEPEPLESDLLERIDALERQKAQKEAEEAARIKALEEARAEALAKKKAEEERMNAQIEARAAAEAEIRQAEEAEALRLKEEEERRKAAEDAARLEAIARRQAEEEARAQEEMRRRAAEEARQRAEAEARAKAEEEARIQAEARARAAAEEEARLKAEAELKAAQDAARIRAQKEAALAAKEEAEFKAAQARKEREEEIARLKKEAEEKQRARTEESAVVEDEVRKALEQTARMRQEEEDKIKAALAGIRGGRFSDTLSSTEKALPEEKPSIRDTIQDKSEPQPPAAAEELVLENVQTGSHPDAETEASDIQDGLSSKGTILAGKEEREEAHRHTRYNIEGMAKAREDFFADLPGGDPEAERRPEVGAEEVRDSIVSPLTRTVDKEAIASGITSTKKLSRDSFDIGEALGTAAASSTQDMHTIERPVEIPQTVEQPVEIPAQEGLTGETEDLLSQFASVMAPKEEEISQEPQMPAAETQIPQVPQMPEAETQIPQAPQMPAAEMQTPQEPQMPAAEAQIPQTPQMPAAETQISQAPAEAGIDDILAQMPSVEPVEDTPIKAPEEVSIEDIAQVTPVEDIPIQQVQPQQPEYDPALEALKAEKPGLEDTMVMPQINRIDEFSKSDFEEYPKSEADELMRLKEAAARQQAESQERTAAAAAEIATTGVSTGEAYDILEQIEQDAQKIQQETEQVEKPEVEAPLTAKEQKKQERAKAKEAKRIAKEKKKEEKRRKKEDAIGDDDKSEIVEAPETAEGVEGAEAAEDTQSKGGKGRIVLMIILILLCVIFALELIGIGIKMFASTSEAANFIDNILNKLIQLITRSSVGGPWIG